MAAAVNAHILSLTNLVYVGPNPKNTAQGLYYLLKFEGAEPEP